MLRRGGGRGHPVEQQAHRGGAQRADGLVDGGERGLGDRALRDIVETDEGDILGHAQAGVAQRMERAHGHRVAGDEHGVGSSGRSGRAWPRSRPVA